MTNINRGFCFNCGEPVDEADYADIGRNRVWVCGASACNRELREEDRAAQAEAHEELDREWNQRW